MDVPSPALAPPLWLLAELTYRCPLHCPFCYNPVEHAHERSELDTAEWLDVLRQARRLGAVQLGFSGGEPLLRDDLEELVGAAHGLGFYTNLLTSGIGLGEARLARLRALGLDHIQLSFQDSTRELNDFLGSAKTFERKAQVARLIKRHGYPMVLNVVLHRFNLDHVGRIIEMALEMGVDYLELANTQYYGWALLNRAQLLPERDQLARAEAVVEAWRTRIGGRMRILFVVPDYFEQRPKACMNGWGAVFLGVAPDGTALPCHAARTLPGIAFPNVRELSLHDIWHASGAFNRFRGSAWMKPPCSTCAERDRDFGGCRCQAWALLGDPDAADPVCAKSPHHGDLQAIVLQARGEQAAAERERPLVFRSNPRRAPRSGTKS